MNCETCHFWRTERFSEGRPPDEKCSLALCTARESVYYNMLVSRKGQCPEWYDNSIKLTFLQNEGMEQGYSPGKDPITAYLKEHPEEEEEVIDTFEYARNRAAATMARAASALRRRRR